MAEKESSALKVEIIAGTVSTVIGGIILGGFPNFRASIMNGLAWIWKTLAGAYVIAGWYLGLLGLLALVGALHLVFRFWPQAVANQPDYFRYTEDVIYNVRWRWRYARTLSAASGVFVLDVTPNWSMVTELGTSTTPSPKPTSICENCDQVMTTIKDGDQNYAVAAVKREIDRRIRTGEYKRALLPLPEQNI